MGDVSLADYNFNAISWAEDIVIFFTQGTEVTQGILNTPNEYCHDNSIQIILDETKALIFCRG